MLKRDNVLHAKMKEKHVHCVHSVTVYARLVNKSAKPANWPSLCFHELVKILLAGNGTES